MANRRNYRAQRTRNGRCLAGRQILVPEEVCKSQEYVLQPVIHASG
jgi:hypothetical protein